MVKLADETFDSVGAATLIYLVIAGAISRVSNPQTITDRFMLTTRRYLPLPVNRCCDLAVLWPWENLRATFDGDNLSVNGR